MEEDTSTASSSEGTENSDVSYEYEEQIPYISERRQEEEDRQEEILGSNQDPQLDIEEFTDESEFTDDTES